MDPFDIAGDTIEELGFTWPGIWNILAGVGDCIVDTQTGSVCLIVRADWTFEYTRAAVEYQLQDYQPIDVEDEP